MPASATKRERQPRQRGVLASQQLRRLVRDGAIAAKSPVEERQYQPASLDLRLGDTAYRMLSSFLPDPSQTIATRLTRMKFYEENLVLYEIDSRNGGVLEKGHVYLIPLLERITLKGQKYKALYGKCNPKSTTGRLDIFTRVITDSNSTFDEIQRGYSGLLYLEVVPLSFSVRVSAGICLNQLRLLEGDSSVDDEELLQLHEKNTLLYLEKETPVPKKELRIDKGIFLRIDLQGGDNGVVGFRARKISAIVDLSKLDYYDPIDFWEPIYRHRDNTLKLEPGEFYVLASKDRIRIPSEYAAEMVAYEGGCGELRTHYAGFFDPGFGYGKGDILGTKIVLEVRPHEVPFMIYHGQILFKIVLERMQERPEKVYGEGIGSSYQFQGLTLSKQFKPYRG